MWIAQILIDYLNCDSFNFYKIGLKFTLAIEVTACAFIVFQEYLFEISAVRAYIYLAEETGNMVDQDT